jgi:hypothetical protein
MASDQSTNPNADASHEASSKSNFTNPTESNGFIELFLIHFSWPLLTMFDFHFLS